MSRQERAKVSLPAIYHVGSAVGEGLVGYLSRDELFFRGPMLPKEGEHIVIKFTIPNGREVTVEGTSAGPCTTSRAAPGASEWNSPATGTTTSSSSRIISGSTTPSTG